jgi:hypothetical protein
MTGEAMARMTDEEADYRKPSEMPHLEMLTKALLS